MEKEHKHTFQELEPGAKCKECGQALCGSTSPGGQSICNLEQGHSGPCMNTHFSPIGTWEKKFVE